MDELVLKGRGFLMIKGNNQSVKNDKVVIPETPTSQIILALLFVPGVYIMLILSALLTVTIGSGLIAIIYYIFAEWLGRIPVGVLLLLGIGMIIGIFAVLKGIFITVWRKASFEPGMLINLEEEPLLKDFIVKLCREMNAKLPKSIIVHSKPTFFVQQGKLRLFNGVTRGRVLAIGLPTGSSPLSICTVAGKVRIPTIGGNLP